MRSIGVSLALLAALAAWAPASTSTGARGRRMVAVGTYTNGREQGIFLFRWDDRTGALEPAGAFGGVENPSFLASSPDGKRLYAVSETGNGSVAALAWQPDGGLKLLNKRDSAGSYPCHLCIDKGGKLVMAANYGSGTLAALPVSAEGLATASCTVQHKGTGPNAQRQEGPHAHSINVDPTGRYAVACDLGTDQIIVYKIDAAGGRITRHSAALAAPGAGPRHLAWHPGGKMAFVINELGNTICSYRWDADAGTLTQLGSAPTLAADFKGASTTAEVVVHPNGRFVYGSNRGEESVVAMQVDAASGKLTVAGRVATGGKTPRNFVIDPTGKWMLAANQDSSSLVVFKLDPQTGLPAPTGVTVSVPMPVCVRFVTAP